jgi:hypothetical protein
LKHKDRGKDNLKESNALSNTGTHKGAHTGNNGYREEHPSLRAVQVNWRPLGGNRAKRGASPEIGDALIQSKTEGIERGRHNAEPEHRRDIDRSFSATRAGKRERNGGDSKNHESIDETGMYIGPQDGHPTEHKGVPSDPAPGPLLSGHKRATSRDKGRKQNDREEHGPNDEMNLSELKGNYHTQQDKEQALSATP